MQTVQPTSWSTALEIWNVCLTPYTSTIWGCYGLFVVLYLYPYLLSLYTCRDVIACVLTWWANWLHPTNHSPPPHPSQSWRRKDDTAFGMQIFPLELLKAYTYASRTNGGGGGGHSPSIDRRHLHICSFAFSDTAIFIPMHAQTDSLRRTHCSVAYQDYIMHKQGRVAKVRPEVGRIADLIWSDLILPFSLCMRVYVANPIWLRDRERESDLIRVCGWWVAKQVWNR